MPQDERHGPRAADRVEQQEHHARHECHVDGIRRAHGQDVRAEIAQLLHRPCPP